jgi:hypothetical protein
MNTIFGPDRQIADLQALGFAVEKVTVTLNPGSTVIFAVLPGYKIEAGQFLGRVIDLGIQCSADFPRSVHSSIHVKASPQLYETQNIAGVRNVIASALGSQWRYWSKNFNWTSERSARRLISQINRIFLDA